MNHTEDELTDLFANIVRERFVLTTEKDRFETKIDKQKIYASYFGRASSILFLSKEGPHLELGFLRIPVGFRGMGFGKQLYVSGVEFGRQLGCTHIRQVPSGIMHDGEDKTEYLLRNGGNEYPDEKYMVIRSL